MASSKPLTPKDVEEAVSRLRRQLQGVTEASLERIDCSPETIEQGLAKWCSGWVAATIENAAAALPRFGWLFGSSSRTFSRTVG